jgi:hypothetical protein
VSTRSTYTVLPQYLHLHYRNNERQSLQHSVVALLLHGKEMRCGNFREMTDFDVRRLGGVTDLSQLIICFGDNCEKHEHCART